MSDACWLLMPAMARLGSSAPPSTRPSASNCSRPARTPMAAAGADSAPPSTPPKPAAMAADPAASPRLTLSWMPSSTSRICVPTLAMPSAPALIAASLTAALPMPDLRPARPACRAVAPPANARRVAAWLAPLAATPPIRLTGSRTAAATLSKKPAAPRPPSSKTPGAMS